MARTDFLHRPVTEWSNEKTAETIRIWQQLLPWGLATVKGAGTHLFEQGSAPQEIFLLERGLVKLSCALPDDRQVLLAFRLPGQLVGGMFVHWVGENYPVSAIAATDCRVSSISGEAMQRALDRNPAVAQFLLRQQGIDLYNQAVALVEAKTLNTSELFTQFVQQLAAVLDLPKTHKSLRVMLPLSDAEIASLLSVTKVYFSRLKKQWEAEGRFHWEGRMLVIP